MTVLDQLPCAVLVTDGQGQVVEANAEMGALVARTRVQLIGSPMDTLFPPAARIFLQTHVWPTVLRDSRVSEAFLYLQGAGGERLPVMVNGRRGTHDGASAFFWTFFLAEQRSRFESALLMARERAEQSAHSLAERERFVKTLIEALPGPLAYWDRNLRCQFANQTYLEWFGAAPLQPGLDAMLAWWLPDPGQASAERVQALLAGRPLSFDRLVQRMDGRSCHALVHCVPDVAGGEVVGFLVQIHDVSTLKRTEAELAEQHELMRVTLQSIGDAVITTDAAGRVQWLNPAAVRITAWSIDEARGRELTDIYRIVDEHTRAPAASPIVACLREGRPVSRSTHNLLLARDGHEYGIEETASPICGRSGEVLGMVLVFHDVSEQRRMTGEMTWRATHDPLTGLLNRSEFETRLQRVLRKSRDDHSEHALLYIDLDQFKLVNDVCGHATGDELLQQVSKLLAEALRARDTLARLGGDEFGVILENCQLAHAQRAAQKICDLMDDFRFVHEDRRFRIGTSIGVVPVDQRWTAISAIQQAADTACYAAKEAGRNRVHVWFDTDEAIRTRKFEMQWTARIERALDEDRFVLHGQRIVPLHGADTGLRAEVLLRMVAPDGSEVLPGAFLPAAERFGLATRVDRWVLRHVVDWLLARPSLEAITSLSVNLSGHSVGDRAFHAWALELLDRAGPDARARLCLEITETAAVTNLADAAAFMARLREAGVKVALDDFGAGASSFGYLKSLPVDALKIDGQFIRNLVSDAFDAAAIRCFVDVARLMKVPTVAEFVDQAAVMAMLGDLGVDYAQGFLLHRPELLDRLLTQSVPLAPAPSALAQHAQASDGVLG